MKFSSRILPRKDCWHESALFYVDSLVGAGRDPKGQGGHLSASEVSALAILLLLSYGVCVVL
jgi:hypothetical protein